MKAHMQEHQDYSFEIGLLAGVLVGAGLATWLASRANPDLRERIIGSARDFGKRASEQFHQASTRAGAAVDELTRQGQGVRDEIAGPVAARRP
jgi:hypothetical protein